jgi:hypothetical protein
VPDMHNGSLGVHGWTEPTGVVAGASRPGNGSFSVADPRAAEAAAQYQQYGVRRWGDTGGAVTGQSAPGGGTHSVADPRCPGVLHNNAFRVVRYADHAQAVTGGTGAVGGCIADPRRDGPSFGKYAVTPWAYPAGTVIAGSTTGQGAFAVADPRSGMDAHREAYLTGGHYGVVRMDEPSGAVSAAACHDNGRWSVADHRLPAAADNLVAVIRAEDGTWHRPFTTLELAALQSLVDPEEQLELDGLSDQAWRERIGNAVPSDAAQAIASEMGRTLLLAWSGETFALSAAPVWVRNVAVGLSVAQPGAAT